MSRPLTKCRGALTLGVIGILGLAAFGCGGGGGSSADDTEDLYVERFSAPNFSGILLDEAVSWVLSESILESSLNHDSVQLRTGPQGGDAPRGSFVKGVFMIDPVTGNRVVVDPDQISASVLDAAEETGNLGLVPNGIRYDLGNDSPLNGDRRVLFDHSIGRVMAFVPAIPTRPDLSDPGYAPGSTYSVIVPAFPALNTVRSISDNPMLPREGRVFTSTFTTVPDTAVTLFLGGENQGRPRVVNTDPANADTNVPVESRIRIRFSHAIDPRTVTTDNFQLNIPSQPGVQQSVSLFLRQSRLGICEVVMTPLTDLTGDTVYQVRVKEGIRDLKDKPLIERTFSFSTGVGFTPSDIVEPFLSTAQMDVGATTAFWNIDYDRNGDFTPDGALVAEYAPWAGDGSDQALLVGSGIFLELPTTELDGTFIEYQHTSIEVELGGTIEPKGSRGLVLRSHTTIIVAGVITVNGKDGATGQTGGVGSSVPTGGAGGAGGAGGFKGGDGAMTTFDGTNFDGKDGQGPYASSAGRGGHTGDRETCVEVFPTPCATETGLREGGGGGAHATGGAFLDASLAKQKPNQPPNLGGTGGAAYAAINPPFLPIVDPGANPPGNWGGAGGGGGGGEDDGTTDGNGDSVANGPDEGGGGGGGGGGGLLLVAYGDITITNLISADGGNGGNTFNAANGNLGEGAAGGGGAGGAIWIQTFGNLHVQSGAGISAVGGSGGSGDGNGYVQTGGDGGNGYIFLQDSNAEPTGSLSGVDPTPAIGTFSPDTVRDSVGVSRFYDQFIVTPNYLDPVVDQALNNGVIQIYAQGSRENLADPGNPVDPDLDPGGFSTTGWVLIVDDGVVQTGAINAVDDYRFLRFKVEMSVDPFQLFSDPLPIVHEIRIPVSTTPDN